jgi:hypothetical protein
MKRSALIIAAVATATPALAQPAPPPQLSLEHRMLVRCSAAFALVARWQQGGRPEVGKYPPLQERGREFFVRGAAKVMYEAKLDREAIEQALLAEARSFLPEGQMTPEQAPSVFAKIDAVMPACLTALEASER